MNANDAEDAGPSRAVTASGETIVHPITSNPVDIAMAEVAAGAPADSPAAVLLSKQSGLVDVHRELAATDLRYRHQRLIAPSPLDCYPCLLTPVLRGSNRSSTTSVTG